MHCHITPQEIAEDRKFDSITQVWLGGDHYKCRFMRAVGILKEKITGNASDWEKFEAFVQAVPQVMGNPVYHWSHLELQRGFGITKPLTPETAREIYDEANEKLKGCSARQLMRKFDVKAVCTTDDPADDLYWHKAIAADRTMEIKVLPAFRPDKALNIEKPGFVEYIHRLSAVVDRDLTSARDVTDALAERIDYFNARGCLCADRGHDTVSSQSGVKNLTPLLNAFVENGGLPKMILYSLNPADNTAVDFIISCFQSGSVAGNGVLGRFVGMLTDSRSFLSYTRHEYFRCILCELIGEWVESGQYPDNPKYLEQIVADICFHNTDSFLLLSCRETR